MPSVRHQGRTIHYRERGSGPLLLVLHGNTASSALHEGELAHFCARFRVVAPDLPGVGGSDRMDVWPLDWWQEGARAAAALAEHLGASRCGVVGTSGGAVAALWMAILRPDLVAAVVADSVVGRHRPDALRANVASRDVSDPGAQGFWRAAHGDDWEQVVRADSDLLLRFAEAGADWFQGRLAEIAAPVLFTVSLADEMLPDVASETCRMVREVRSLRAFVVGEGAHPLMWSRPEVFREAADAFLERHYAPEP